MIRSLLILILSCLCVSAQQAFFVPSNNGTGINGGGGGTAGTIVQSKWSSSGTGSASVTLSVTAGNLLVVMACCPGAGTLVSGDVHDGVASYTMDKQTTSGNQIGSWHRVAGASGSITITANPSGAGAVNICVWEVSNLTFKAFDAGTFTTSTGLSATSGSFTTTSAGALFGMESDGNGNTITHTATSGFVISDSTNAHQDDNSGANIAGAAEHQSSSAAGIYAATMTLTSDQGSGAVWTFLGVGYK